MTAPPDAELTRRRSAGAVGVVVAQVVDGAAAYLFLVIAGRTLGNARFAPVSVMWAAQFLAGSGVFIAFEQELARAVAGRVPTRELLSSLRSTVGRVFAAYAAVMAIAAAAGGRWFTSRFLDGDVLTFVGLVVGVAGYATTHLVRGWLAGVGWLDLYTRWFLLDAGVCTATTVALAVAGVRSPGPYAMAGGGCSLVAVAVVAFAAQRRLRTGATGGIESSTATEPLPAGPPDEPPGRPLGTVRTFAEAIAALTIAALLMAVLVNGGPLAVRWYAAAGEAGRTSVFLTGLVLTRVPLLIFQTLQSVLIPRMSAAVTRGAYRELRTMVIRLTVAVVALAVVGTAAAGVVVRPIIVAFFGDSFSGLTPGDLAFQAAAAFTLVFAVVFAMVLIATSHQRRVPLAWGLGVATFLVTVRLDAELFVRVERALVASGGVAAVTMGVLAAAAITGRDRSGARA